MTAFLSTINFADPYFPVLLMLVLAVAIAIGMVALSQALGPKQYDKVKFDVYECGVDPFSSSTIRVSIKFYLVAILFLLFDLESAFLYPWAILFRSLGMFGFIEMIVFLGILLAGLIYVWKKGALEWQ